MNIYQFQNIGAVLSAFKSLTAPTNNLIALINSVTASNVQTVGPVSWTVTSNLLPGLFQLFAPSFASKISSWSYLLGNRLKHTRASLPHQRGWWLCQFSNQCGVSYRHSRHVYPDVWLYQDGRAFLPLTGAFASQANDAMEGVCLHSLFLVAIYLITSDHQFGSGVEVGKINHHYSSRWYCWLYRKSSEPYAKPLFLIRFPLLTWFLRHFIISAWKSKHLSKTCFRFTYCLWNTKSHDRRSCTSKSLLIPIIPRLG